MMLQKTESATNTSGLMFSDTILMDVNKIINTYQTIPNV